MSFRKLITIACFFSCLLVFNICKAQESEEKPSIEIKDEVRGKNAVTLAGGTSILNGDFVDPMWEIYFHAGYKRFLGSHVNVNFVYHKFNLAYTDMFNKGYMSFDLNLEAYLMPYDAFSPFIYAGGGLNAANYFETTDSKVQGGGGLEYLFTERIGVKLFAEYNYVFSDMIDGLEAGAGKDTYWRMGFGLNLYFGKRLQNKISSKIPTVINSSPLVDDY